MRRAAAVCVALLAACNTDSSAPHLARGNVLVNNGKREEAVAEYREAARLAPKSALARERLGDTLYDLGRRSEALEAYRDAARIDPDSVTAHIGAARVLGDQGDYAVARAELTAALEKAPSNLFLLLSRGNYAAKAGDREAAIADYTRAVNLKSDNVPALYQLGMALLDKGDLDGAGRTFDRLVQVAPSAPGGHFGRARSFALRGEGGKAAEELGTASRLVAGDARARLAEQGLKGEALEKEAGEAARRSLEQMRGDPAFAKLATDPRFRREAGWP
jgi:tetratricopeptide (TPR) repeat protein